MRKMLMALLLLWGTAVALCAQDLDEKYAAELLKPGTEAPDMYIGRSKEGKPMRLSELRGRHVLLYFWASWCGPCRWAIPKVEQLYKRYGADRLAVVSVSLDKKREDWEKALKQENMPWTQLGVDGNDMLVTVSRAYHITRIPRLLLIAPVGRVVFSGHDVNALRLTVEKLL